MVERPRVLHEVRGSLIVYVGSAAAPRDAEWDAYLRSIEGTGKQMDQVRIVIFTAGGAPTPLQRKRAAELSARYPHRAAVVSGNPVARAIVTLLHWLGTDIRAFAPDAADQAFASLGTTEAEKVWAVAARDRMQAELE